MRELAHLLSVVLVVPSLAFASMFVALGHATAQKGLLAFLLALLESIVVLLPWLLACVAMLVALSIMGFSRRYRSPAAIGVGAIAVVSTGVLIWIEGTFRGDDVAFHMPAAIALAISVWLAVTDSGEAPTGPANGSGGAAPR